MARGKYASKAMNRAAAVDNEVIVELRAKLAAVEQERTKLVVALNNANRKLTSEVGALVTKAVQVERESLAEQHEQLRAELAAERKKAAELLVRFVREWIDELEDRFGSDKGILPSRLFGGKVGSSELVDWDLVSLLELLDNDNGGALIARLFSELKSCKDDPDPHGRAARRRSARRVADDIRWKENRRKHKDGGPLLLQRKRKAPDSDDPAAVGE